MKNSQKLNKERIEIKALIDSIAPEKMDRAIYVLKYMVEEATTTEDRKAIVEYSKRDDVTMDMIVAWVREKEKELVLHAG